MHVFICVMVLFFACLQSSASDVEAELKTGKELLAQLTSMVSAEKSGKTIYLEVTLENKSIGCEERTFSLEMTGDKIELLSTRKTYGKFDNGVKSTMSGIERCNTLLQPLFQKIDATATLPDGLKKTKYQQMTVKDGKFVISSDNGTGAGIQEESHALPEGEFIGSSEWLFHYVKLEKIDSFAFRQFSLAGGPLIVRYTKAEAPDGGFKLNISMNDAQPSSYFLFDKNGIFQADGKMRPSIESRRISKERFDELKAGFEK